MASHEVGFLAISSKDLPFWLVSDKDKLLLLYIHVEWKFVDLVGTPSRTLLVYSDVVSSNIVG